MDFDEAVLKRRSVRKFKDIPMPEEIIDKMLLMAQAAPSAGNGQNHLFGIVRDKKQSMTWQKRPATRCGLPVCRL